MRQILLLGSGKIGRTIAQMLCHSGDYHVTVADRDASNLEQVEGHEHVKTLQLDLSNERDLNLATKSKYAVIAACPFTLTHLAARAAARAGVHYFDLTEDVKCTKLVKKLAKGSKAALMPQCGLAPGFITIAAHDIAKKFDDLHDLHMRVGALPKYPSNGLKYNLTWSTDGLINEYCNSCEAIVEGNLIQVPPLEELERFSLDGMEYEAFNTSGGLGTLCDTLKGKVRNLNYRTVRYPGHRDIMKLLLHDLRFIDRRNSLKEIFENSLPITYQDVVLIFINASGIKNGELVQESYANKIYHQNLNDKHCSAIQVTTAAGVCTVLDLMSDGKLPQCGFVRQEDVDYKDFINNRFGKVYRMDNESNNELRERNSKKQAA